MIVKEKPVRPEFFVHMSIGDTTRGTMCNKIIELPVVFQNQNGKHLGLRVHSIFGEAKTNFSHNH